MAGSIKFGGIKFNYGKNGFTSVTVGRRGSSINFGKKGTRVTLGGVTVKSRKVQHVPTEPEQVVEPQERAPGVFGRFVKCIWVIMLLFFFPFMFPITLRKGYGCLSRLIAVLWFFVFALVVALAYYETGGF